MQLPVLPPPDWSTAPALRSPTAARPAASGDRDDRSRRLALSGASLLALAIAGAGLLTVALQVERRRLGG